MKNKKKKHLLAWIFASVFVLLVLIRVLGIVDFYRVSSANMYPAIEPGSYILGTRLGKAKTGDIIYYRSTWGFKPNPTENVIIASRFVASAGDTVQLVEGAALVNGNQIDAGFDPAFTFFISSDLYQKHSSILLPQKHWNNPELQFRPLPPNGEKGLVITTRPRISQINDSVTVPIDNSFHKDLLSRVNPEIIKEYRAEMPESWTLLNWGPYVVREGEIFVLGDNRTGSEDSRFRKVSEENLLGTIWGIW